MPTLLRTAASAALALCCLVACHREADTVQPITLTGEWRLVKSGGGITGIIESVPASSDICLVFRADNTYAAYTAGKLEATNSYQLGSRPSYPGGPQQQVLVLTTYSTLDQKAQDITYYVDNLSATELSYRTIGGCPLIKVYEKLSSKSTVGK